MSAAPTPMSAIVTFIEVDALMDRNNRNALIAAAVILVGFGLVAFYMPTIMLAVGEVSPAAAGLIAILFVAAFFLVFWWRGRSQRNRKD
jgi:hypothetical protein